MMTKAKFIAFIIGFTFLAACTEEEPIIEYVIVTETVVKTVTVRPYSTRNSRSGYGRSYLY